MSQFDPFGNAGDDKTVLRPSPGGRMPSPQPARATAPMPAAPSAVSFQELASFNLKPVAGGISLLDLVGPILSLAARLRNSVAYPAVDELKQKLAKQVSDFESQAIGAGIAQDQVRMASYCLCSFLDETIQNTPWGNQSNWGQQSLLIVFHKEAWGGERFFQIVEQIVKQPAQNIFLLEFCHVLISLGFEGKYRLINNGLNELERQRLDLYQLIQRVRGDSAPELSPRWQGQQVGRSALMKQVPLWVFASIAAGLLLLWYLGFSLLLNNASDPVYRQLLELSKQPLPIAATSYVAPVPAPLIKARMERFRPLLHDEIAADMVEVVGDNTLRIHNSFASGSDQLKPEFVPMLQKIARELQNDQDTILVTGHTDDVPIVSARFPSNWHLSTARAKNVLAMLKSSAQLRGNTRAEGRGDAEPLVNNDSKEHRAINRRVDILIK